MRRTALRRKTPLKARTNKDGKPRERFEGLRDEEYRTWIRQRPCAVASLTCAYARGPEGYASDADHIENKARGLGDDSLLPLCHRHHMERHAYGNRAFERAHKVRLAKLVGEYQLLWEAERGVPSL